jgi:hypothetical protein
VTDTLHPPRGRMRDGLAFEYRLAARLVENDWRVAFLGQDALPPWLRVALQPIPECGLRFQPDLIALRGERVVAIDAKSSRGFAPIEVAELNAHDALQTAWRVPFWYVFGDGRCVSLATIQLAPCKPGPHKGNGSGKPYVIVPGNAMTTFDAEFGEQ